jgi:cytochrome c553
LVAVAVAAALGCPKGPPVRAAYRPDGPLEGPAEAPGPSPPDRAKEPQIVARMHEIFGAVERIHAALIRGDLAQAQRDARGLAEAAATAGDVPDAWAEPMEDLRRAAQGVADAADHEAGAEAIAILVTQCGACHRTLQVVPQVPDPPEPPGADAAMQLHAWGVARMWEGLVIPSADRFMKGTATLAVARSCEAVATRLPEQADACHRLELLASRSHVADAPEVRADLYGRLLATCAECHARPRTP